MKIYLKLIGLAFILMFVLSLFSVAGILLKATDREMAILQMTAFLFSAICLYFYIKRKDNTLKAFGFRKIKIETFSIVVVLFMLLVIAIQPLILGIDNSLSFSNIFLITLQMILVGLVEETFFRGVFYYYLKNKTAIVYILFSSIVFGVLHITSGINPDTTPILVVLQFGNTLLLNAVFSLIYLKIQSIYPVIIFHTLFDLLASISNSGSLQQNIFIVDALSFIYSLFLFFYGITHWNPLKQSNKKVKRNAHD
ncbi:CPBP family intramembrane metalloprotease [Listeria monocytogenes]|nr:CPBP family intramembrane metalloprotease [Listeria monocytogenes]